MVASIFSHSLACQCLVLELIVLLMTQFPMAKGHGRLLDPPSRASMWRLGFDSPADYDDHQGYCGGKNALWNRFGGKCGVCGDPVRPVPRPHERGGRYYTGTPTRVYQSGDRITITMGITANHRGWVEFRVCPYDNPEPGDVELDEDGHFVEVTQDCLDRHLLELEDGQTRFYLPEPYRTGDYSVTARLPLGLQCEQCLFQWKWNVGNSWGTDADGTSCIGCGEQEQFYACADIVIESSDNNVDPSHSETDRPRHRPKGPRARGRKGKGHRHRSREGERRRQRRRHHSRNNQHGTRRGKGGSGRRHRTTPRASTVSTSTQSPAATTHPEQVNSGHGQDETTTFKQVSQTNETEHTRHENAVVEDSETDKQSSIGKFWWLSRHIPLSPHLSRHGKSSGEDTDKSEITDHQSKPVQDKKGILEGHASDDDMINTKTKGDHGFWEWLKAKHLKFPKHRNSVQESKMRSSQPSATQTEKESQDVKSRVTWYDRMASKLHSTTLGRILSRTIRSVPATHVENSSKQESYRKELYSAHPKLLAKRMNTANSKNASHSDELLYKSIAASNKTSNISQSDKNVVSSPILSESLRLKTFSETGVKGSQKSTQAENHPEPGNEKLNLGNQHQENFNVKFEKLSRLRPAFPLKSLLQDVAHPSVLQRDMEAAWRSLQNNLLTSTNETDNLLTKNKMIFHPDKEQPQANKVLLTTGAEGGDRNVFDFLGFLSNILQKRLGLLDRTNSSSQAHLSRDNNNNNNNNDNSFHPTQAKSIWNQKIQPVQNVNKDNLQHTPEKSAEGKFQKEGGRYNNTLGTSLIKKPFRSPSGSHILREKKQKGKVNINLAIKPTHSVKTSIPESNIVSHQHSVSMARHELPMYDHADIHSTQTYGHGHHQDESDHLADLHNSQTYGHGHHQDESSDDLADLHSSQTYGHGHHGNQDYHEAYEAQEHQEYHDDHEDEHGEYEDHEEHDDHDYEDFHEEEDDDNEDEHDDHEEENEHDDHEEEDEHDDHEEEDEYEDQEEEDEYDHDDEHDHEDIHEHENDEEEDEHDDHEEEDEHDDHEEEDIHDHHEVEDDHDDHEEEDEHDHEDIHEHENEEEDDEQDDHEEEDEHDDHEEEDIHDDHDDHDDEHDHEDIHEHEDDEEEDEHDDHEEEDEHDDHEEEDKHGDHEGEDEHDDHEEEDKHGDHEGEVEHDDHEEEDEHEGDEEEDEHDDHEEEDEHDDHEEKDEHEGDEEEDEHDDHEEEDEHDDHEEEDEHEDGHNDQEGEDEHDDHEEEDEHDHDNEHDHEDIQEHEDGHDEHEDDEEEDEHDDHEEEDEYDDHEEEYEHDDHEKEDVHDDYEEEDEYDKHDHEDIHEHEDEIDEHENETDEHDENEDEHDEDDEDENDEHEDEHYEHEDEHDEHEDEHYEHEDEHDEHKDEHDEHEDVHDEHEDEHGAEHDEHEDDEDHDNFDDHHGDDDDDDDEYHEEHHVHDEVDPHAWVFHKSKIDSHDNHGDISLKEEMDKPNNEDTSNSAMKRSMSKLSELSDYSSNDCDDEDYGMHSDDDEYHGYDSHDYDHECGSYNDDSSYDGGDEDDEEYYEDKEHDNSHDSHHEHHRDDESHNHGLSPPEFPPFPSLSDDDYTYEYTYEYDAKGGYDYSPYYPEKEISTGWKPSISQGATPQTKAKATDKEPVIICREDPQMMSSSYENEQLGHLTFSLGKERFFVIPISASPAAHHSRSNLELLTELPQSVAKDISERLVDKRCKTTLWPLTATSTGFVANKPSKNNNKAAFVESTLQVSRLKGSSCIGAGQWAHLEGMSDWCQLNCERGYCPESHCRCF